MTRSATRWSGQHADRERETPMAAQLVFSEQSMTSILLILSNVLTLIGVMLWTGRNMWRSPLPASANYLVFSPADIYYPVLFYPMPLVIALTLWARL